MMKRPEQRKTAFRMKRHKRPEQHDNGKIFVIFALPQLFEDNNQNNQNTTK